jgi:hypothetical protein
MPQEVVNALERLALSAGELEKMGKDSVCCVCREDLVVDSEVSPHLLSFEGKAIKKQISDEKHIRREGVKAKN